MSYRLFTALIWIATLTLACADEKLALLNVGGLMYTNVTVTAVYATDIFFSYDGGLANAKLKELDPELQQHFQYDPQIAQQVEQNRAAANIQYHHNLASEAAYQSSTMTNAEAAQTAPPSAAGNIIWAKTFLGQKAPELVVEKWLTREPDRQGKFVLVNFWATWCPPCHEAILELNDLHRKFADKLVVIGLSDEDETAVRKQIDPGIEYFSAVDTQARMKQAAGVTGVPHVLVIDPQGIVRWEGYPFLGGYGLNDKIVADLIARYSQ